MADEMLKNAQPQELESQIGEEDGLKAVSYTHLTLPTILRV